MIVRVDRIELYQVAMPIKQAFRTAVGAVTETHSVLVKLDFAEQFGWAESTALDGPFFAPDWTPGIFEVLNTWMGPALLGCEIGDGNGLQAALAAFRGHEFAKAALDVAWWDAYAKLRGKPLWQLIGGERSSVEVGADVGIGHSIDGVVREVGKALADGYVRIKLKIMPGRDVEVVRAVRRKYPLAVIHVDCNGAYRMASVSTFRELDQYDLAMIEQPLSYDDLLDHAKLQNELATPICLDESVTSIDKARKAIEIGACRWINVKVGRVGGLTNAVLIHDLCKKNGIGCLVGGMLESALGQAASLALATLPNFTYPADIFSSDQFYQVDLAEPAIQLAGPSRIEANAEPGLGRVPNADLLTKMTIRKAVLRHE
jgi:O-succinylbenzoate synthase